MVRSFEGIPSVGSVVPGSEAERAGLTAGDSIININGEPPSPEVENQMSLLRPGDVIRVDIKGADGLKQLSWKLGSREEVEFALKDVDNVSPQQRARRAAWLAGEDEKPGETRP
jgi:predicted metalloprotease with PDZ domain